MTLPRESTGFRDRIVRRIWGPTWDAEAATLIVFQGRSERVPLWLVRRWNRAMSWLDRYLCLVLPHSWAPIYCASHFPEHVSEWICMRCYRHEDEAEDVVALGQVVAHLRCAGGDSTP